MKNVINFNEFINEGKNETNDEKVLFSASTKGDLYSIKAFEDEDGRGYFIKEFKHDRSTGLASMTGKKALVDRLLWDILGSKDVDGINYIINMDKLGIKEELEKYKEVYKTWYSKEFKEWRKKWSDEDRDKYLEDIKKLAKTAVEKDGVESKNIDDYCHIVQKKYLVDKFLKK